VPPRSSPLALHAACGPRTLPIRPLAVSAAVAEALTAGDPVLQARHRLGASLTLPGTDDAVFLSRPGIGLLPAHIVVRARDLERVLSASERPSGQRLALHVDVRGVRTFRLRLAPDPVAMRCARARANVLATARWLSASPAPPGPATAAELLASFGDRLKQLVAARRVAPPADLVLRSLIGQGAGATPAGDDVVIGVLAHAWLTRGREAPVMAAMRSLEPELSALTSTVGATYLRAAIRGEFGSHLVAWVRALPRASPQRALALARRVSSHGATSGYDTLAGFLAGADADGATQ
jgi:Protein of unknown function (DUF2877)